MAKDRTAHFVQVAALSFFLFLVACYIVIMAPLLWFETLYYVAIGIYLPFVAAVLILLVRFIGINPTDPSVIRSQSGFAKEEQASRIRQFLDMFCRIWICWYPQGQCQRKQQPIAVEDILFCTICKAEVGRLSKHCRACDKCIEGFDHHCWWLSKCVGRRNYRTFISMLASLLGALILECFVGILIIVRCFADNGILVDIHIKLGAGFSRSFPVVIAIICTIVPLLLCYPVGELFFFHILLIKKGISTYDYILAMRAQMDKENREEVEASLQKEVLPPEPSTPTGESTNHCSANRGRVASDDKAQGGSCTSEVGVSRNKKSLVTISPWQLAKINSQESAQIAAMSHDKMRLQMR